MKETTKLIIENCENQLSEWLFLEYSHSIQLWENIVFTNIGNGFDELKEKANCYEKHFYEIFENPSEKSLSKINNKITAKDNNELTKFQKNLEKSEIENRKYFSYKKQFKNIKENIKNKIAENFNEKIRNETSENSKEKTIVLDPLAEKELKTNDFKNLDFVVVGGILGDREFTGKTKKLISDKIKCEKRNLGKIQLSIDISVFVAKLIYLGKKLKEIELTNEVEIFLSENHSITLPYGYPIIDGKLILTPKLVEYLKKDGFYFS